MRAAEDTGKGKGRHRPLADWAIRCRTWTWYAAVMSRHYQVDDDMDVDFVPGAADRAPDERFRTFARIRRLGQDPTKERKDGTTLVDAVDADARYKGTAKVYRSSFWELLKPPAKTPDQIDRLIDSLAAARGLYRATSAEAPIGKTPYPKAPGFALGATVTDEYRKFTEALAVSGDIDDLALLCALYRQAVFSFSVEHAKHLMNEVMEASTYFASRISLHDDAQLLFDALITRRVIGNDWSLQASDEAIAIVKEAYKGARSIRGKKLLDRRIQVHALYIDDIIVDKNVTRPFVPVSPKTTKQLKNARKKVGTKDPKNAHRNMPSWLYKLDPAFVNTVAEKFSPYNSSVEDDIKARAPESRKEKAKRKAQAKAKAKRRP